MHTNHVIHTEALFSNDALKEQQINAANTVLQAFGHARTMVISVAVSLCGWVAICSLVFPNGSQHICARKHARSLCVLRSTTITAVASEKSYILILMTRMATSRSPNHSRFKMLHTKN